MPDISGPNRRGRCSLRRPIIPTHMVSVFRWPRSTARERNASIAAMDVLAALSAALAALRAGRVDDARRAAERIWRQSSDAREPGSLRLPEPVAGGSAWGRLWND